MDTRAEEGPWPARGSPRRRSSWSAALLAASILNSCFLLTQPWDVSVRSVPNQPRKAKNVTLTPGGKADFVMCFWFRGEQTDDKRIFTYIPSLSAQQNGPAFTGRETAGSGCSLSIRSLDVSDSEVYTVSKIVADGYETGYVEIAVPEKTGLGAGAIVGIVTGALLATVLVGGLVYYTVRRRRQQVNQKVSVSSTSTLVSAEETKV